MRKIIYVLFAIVIAIAFHNDAMAQGVHIWKGGIRMTIYTNDVDSLVFFDKNGENQSTQTPDDEDLEILPPTLDTLMKPILFDAYEGRTTRAASSNSSNSLTESGFGVFAYDLGNEAFMSYAQEWSVPNLMYNQSVMRNHDGNWEYSPLKYWGYSSQRYAFFAYAPYVPSSSSYLYELSDSQYAKSIKGFTFGPNGPMLAYALTDNPNDDIDLCWGQGMNESTAPVDYGTFYGEKVTFNFKHALAKLKIHVKLAENGGWSPEGAIMQGVELVGQVPNVASLSLYNGIWNVTGYTDKIRLLSEGKAVNQSSYTDVIGAESGCRYLIPDNDYEVQIGIEDNIYRFKLPSKLEAGKVYDAFVDISKSRMNLQFTVSDWSDDRTVNVWLAR